MENGATWMDIPNMNSSEFSTNDASSKRYRCFAMNVVRFSSYNATSMEFQVNNSGNGKLAFSFILLPFVSLSLSMEFI